MRDEFVVAFNNYYISKIVRTCEFLNLEQGDKSVTIYEQKNVNLSYFATHFHLIDITRERLLETKLTPRYKNYVVPQRLKILREVVDTTLLLEWNKKIEKKSCEA